MGEVIFESLVVSLIGEGVLAEIGGVYPMKSILGMRGFGNADTYAEVNNADNLPGAVAGVQESRQMKRDGNSGQFETCFGFDLGDQAVFEALGVLQGASGKIPKIFTFAPFDNQHLPLGVDNKGFLDDDEGRGHVLILT